MAQDAIVFLDALDLTDIDLLSRDTKQQGRWHGISWPHPYEDKGPRRRPDDPALVLPHDCGAATPATGKIYPDAAHGLLFQHDEEFASYVLTFLHQEHSSTL